MADQNKQDFATSGTESFKLSGSDKKEPKVILTIQEEAPEGILLEERTKIGEKITGNVIVDVYNKINNY